MKGAARPSFLAFVALTFAFAPLQADVERFRRGDANGDGHTDISDPVHTLLGLFAGGEAPPCAKASDSNDDGRLDISDPSHTLSFLFTGGSAPAAPGSACGRDATPDELGCASYPACPQGPFEGQTDFTIQGVPPNPGRADEDASPGAPGAPAPPAADPAGPAEEREIEESDIYRLDGDLLYVMNRYRGLQVVDIADLDAPKMIGKAPIYGQPLEMYVRGSLALILVSDYYSYWRGALAEDSIYGFHGSQLVVLDVSDPSNPTTVGSIKVEGAAEDSRIVGDVMYLVVQRYPWYSRYTDDTVDRTQIVSVDLSDPANVHVVQTADFPRNGWQHNVHVTSDTVYLAASGYTGDDWRNSLETRVRLIDISDPDGAIALRGEGTVPGMVFDRWAMDEHNGVLRVASGQSWGNGDVFLTTLDVSNPDLITRLGQYTLRVNERLTAARFDGSRGYLVSYRNIDPLFSFDLSDPRRPILTGELEMSGWLDYIVPQGDRIVALGHEDLVKPDGSREISLAVSLIDVSAGAPKLLSRVSVGASWGWVPADRNDFNKVFKVLPERNLVLFPFYAWSRTTWRPIWGVQLIDLDLASDTLTRRGLIDDGGAVERGIPHVDDTVLTLSSEVLQVMDIRDRDNPRLRSRLDLARNVQEIEILGGNSAQLAGDGYQKRLELITTPLSDPDAVEPLGRLSLDATSARLFTNGDLAYALLTREKRNDQGTVVEYSTVVEAIDLADPAHPVVLGSLTLPETVWVSQGWRGWWGGGGDAVEQVNGSTLAILKTPYSWWWGCLACDMGPVAAAAAPEEPVYKLHLVDLSDPTSPELASTVTFPRNSWTWGLKASGSFLYTTTSASYTDTAGMWWTRYYLDRIDARDPSNPVKEQFNIPGSFIDASPDGLYAYTQETRWNWNNGNTPPTTTVYALALDGETDKAYLQSKVEVPGYPYGFILADGGLFTVANWWEIQVVEGQSRYVNHAQLVAIDVTDPAALAVRGKAEVPFDYAFLSEVAGGRAFAGTWAGVFTFDVRDLDNLLFEQFFRTQSWPSEIEVGPEAAYIPSGYHGVQVLDLRGGAGAP